MENNQRFKIKFDQNWATKNTILTTQYQQKLKVLSTPERKWYKILLQIITFGWYKAPYEYTVEIMKDFGK